MKQPLFLWTTVDAASTYFPCFQAPKSTLSLKLQTQHHRQFQLHTSSAAAQFCQPQYSSLTKILWVLTEGWKTGVQRYFLFCLKYLILDLFSREDQGNVFTICNAHNLNIFTTFNPHHHLPML